MESHPPCLYPMTASIAVCQREAGDVDEALATLAMHGGWLRPSEGCELEVNDILLPEEVNLVAGGSGALLRIAPGGRAAKVGRPQPASIEGGPALVAIRALKIRGRRFRRRKVLEGGYVKFQKSFDAGVVKAGLKKLKLTPHGLRAGGCTESKHRGESSGFRQEKGRWGSKNAMRVYTDQVGAIAASQQVSGEAARRLHEACAHLLELIPELREGLVPGVPVEDQMRVGEGLEIERPAVVAKRLTRSKIKVSADPNLVEPAWW